MRKMRSIMAVLLVCFMVFGSFGSALAEAMDDVITLESIIKIDPASLEDVTEEPTDEVKATDAAMPEVTLETEETAEPETTEDAIESIGNTRTNCFAIVQIQIII